MDVAELEAYRRRHLRARNMSWLSVLFGSLGIGLAVGFLWSVPAGIVAAIVLANIGLTLHLRWDKARWIKRFPELADPGVTWRRRYWL
jgi:hypothetical protein